LASGTYVVAQWTDSTYAVVARNDLGPNSVSHIDLGFYPPSYKENANVMALMRKALRYVLFGSTPSPSPSPSLSPSPSSTTPPNLSAVSDHFKSPCSPFRVMMAAVALTMLLFLVY
jgi:hypothetical protein